MDLLKDPDLIPMVLAAIAAAATVYSLAIPLVGGDSLDKRMRAVAVERDKIRARERDRMLKGRGTAIRERPTARIKQLVERFRLSDWLGTEQAKMQLTQAGLRGQKAEYLFLVARLVVPIGLVGLSFLYLFAVDDFGISPIMRVAVVMGFAYIGIKLPELYLKNTIQKRQLSMRRAWPDAVDLMLICVESGMSIEQAFKRVSLEVGANSIPLAEELALANAEMSYLNDRRLAYENLAIRTGLEAVKNVTTALTQADRYGTPVGQALRVLAQESRDQRMNEAEKKAAGLPPKLTVPMIIFFLPVLFAVLMTPALVQLFDSM